MQRFFVTFPLSIDVVLTDIALHNQITRVLRMKVGDHVVLFNGDTTETEYEIQAIDKKTITLRGIAQQSPRTEPREHITLYQALPNKYEKIEYILQKGVEVGIRKFVFFRADHSQKLVITASKIARFRLIMREALEQCGGMILPEIEIHEKMPHELIQGGTKHIVLDTTGVLTKMSEQDIPQDIGLWVGPEGGWSEEERTIMRDYGFIFARFGERIMRTETAGPTVAFAFLFR